MSVIHDFKQFVMRGNVVDLAVGVVIGAAFSAIVNSLVGDIIMPTVGLLTSGVDFSKSAFVLKAATDDKPAVLLSYGKLVQSSLNFIIVSFVIFLVVKGMTALKKRHAHEPPPAPLSTQEKLLTEIRDLLKTHSSISPKA